MNHGPIASQANHPILSLSFSTCKWPQALLAHRVAVRAQCLARGRHSASVHALPPFLVDGAYLYPTPFQEPQETRQTPSSVPLICCRKMTSPLVEFLGLSPGAGRWRGGEGVPNTKCHVVSTGGGCWGSLCRAVSHQLGAAEGSKWPPGRLATPRDSRSPRGLCVSEPQALAELNKLQSPPHSPLRWGEGTGHIRETLWAAGLGPDGSTDWAWDGQRAGGPLKGDLYHGHWRGKAEAASQQEEGHSRGLASVRASRQVGCTMATRPSQQTPQHGGPVMVCRHLVPSSPLL